MHGLKRRATVTHLSKALWFAREWALVRIGLGVLLEGACLGGLALGIAVRCPWSKAIVAQPIGLVGAAHEHLVPGQVVILVVWLALFLPWW